MLARTYGAALRFTTERQSWPLTTAKFGLDEAKQQTAMRDTTFLNGLRGIAALYVVSSHIALSYAVHLVNPCCSPGSDGPTLFQRPILRLVASGHSWVAIFFILLGFVNALKPLSLLQAGQVDKASQKLANSTFGRVLRLMLPAGFATMISWLICQLGLYELARNSDAFWLRENTPGPSPNIFAALVDLKTGLVETWRLGGSNPYDQPQWALLYLLLGSFLTIFALLITINMTALWRFVVLTILVWSSMNWSHVTSDPYVGLACYGGVILAELSLSSLPERLSKISPYVSPFVAVFALVLMSYPSENPSAAPWSASMEVFGRTHFGDVHLDRIFGSIGGVLLLASIMISPHARFCLSTKPFRWLGKVSFAIYLVHGTILRSVFAWVMFFGSELVEIQEMVNQSPIYPSEALVSYWRYPMPGAFRRVLATVIALVTILLASHLWATKVEPLCGTIAELVERLVRGQLTRDDAIEAASPSAAEKQPILPLRRD